MRTLKRLGELPLRSRQDAERVLAAVEFELFRADPTTIRPFEQTVIAWKVSGPRGQFDQFYVTLNGQLVLLEDRRIYELHNSSTLLLQAAVDYDDPRSPNGTGLSTLRKPDIPLRLQVNVDDSQCEEYHLVSEREIVEWMYDNLAAALANGDQGSLDEFRGHVDTSGVHLEFSITKYTVSARVRALIVFAVANGRASAVIRSTNISVDAAPFVELFVDENEIQRDVYAALVRLVTGYARILNLFYVVNGPAKGFRLWQVRPRNEGLGLIQCPIPVGIIRVGHDS